MHIRAIPSALQSIYSDHWHHSIHTQLHTRMYVYVVTLSHLTCSA